jgi:hypothetical protein
MRGCLLICSEVARQMGLVADDYLIEVYEDEVPGSIKIGAEARDRDEDDPSIPIALVVPGVRYPVEDRTEELEDLIRKWGPTNEGEYVFVKFSPCNGDGVVLPSLNAMSSS